jgi:hypothetical protein
MSLTCNQLVTPQALYDFNPNFGTDPSPKPTDLVQSMADAGGVICGWLNQTSGDRISLGVLKLTEDSLATVRAAANARGEATTQFAGVFRYTAGIGHAESFERGYWIVVDSPAFIEPAEVNAFLDAVRDAIR